MTPAYAAKLDLIPRHTNVGAQKINCLTLKTYIITITEFLVIDKHRWIKFFKETFLLTDTSIEVVLGMPFFLLSYVDINFKGAIRGLTWRFYTTTKALPTNNQIQLINKRKLAKEVLDENSKTFMIYIAALKASEITEMAIHPFWLAQVLLEAQLAIL